MPEVILKRCLWLTLALAVSAVLMGALGPDNSRDLPYRYDSPLIALELAGSATEAAKITDKPGSETWKRFRNHLLLDMLFLAAYGALFFLLGRLLTSRPQASARLFGRAAMAAAAASALFDTGENWLIWTVMNGQDNVAALRTVSLAKWGAVGATALFLSPLFIPRLPLERAVKLYSGIAFFFYVVTSATLIGGVLDGPRHYALEHAVTPLGLAVLAQTTCFLGRKNRAEFIDLQVES